MPLSEQNISKMAERHLQNTSLFLTGVRVSPGNAINVFIDGDEGVKIADCVSLSRYLESNLDRDSEDFSLDVSSHGASSPLLFPRQYKKNLGRELEIKLQDGNKAEGKLLNVDDEGIQIEFSVREAKPIGKGKMTVIKQQNIKYNNIKEAKIKLKF